MGSISGIVIISLMQWNFNFLDQWDKFLQMCDIYPGNLKWPVAIS